MATPYDVPQNFTTTLNVPGGITDATTSGIILTSVTNLPTDGGVLCFDWSTTLDPDVADFVEYTGISGNTLTGVTRGVEGFTARAHSNGCAVAGVISRAHIKRLRDKLTGNDAVLAQDPNGNEVVKTAYTASAVNEITITNAATGAFPTISATGEADTGIDFENSEGEEILKLDAAASAVNEVSITNAATGAAPEISATGGDTNIGLKLTPKGTGTIQTPAGAMTYEFLRGIASPSNATFDTSADVLATQDITLNKQSMVFVGFSCQSRNASAQIAYFIPAIGSDTGPSFQNYTDANNKLISLFYASLQAAGTITIKVSGQSSSGTSNADNIRMVWWTIPT